MLKKYVDFLYKFKWLLSIAFTLLFALSVQETRHLKLKSDFKELLPDNFQSVKDLNRIVERVGGTGSLIVAIESPDPKKSIQFGEDLVTELKKFPPEFISNIEINASKTKSFFEQFKYMYLNLEDIKQIHDKLNQKIQQEKLKASGLYLNFDDEPTNSNPFSDIEEKYKSKISQYDHYLDGYFFDKDQKLMAIVIKPPSASTGIDFSKKLVAKVNETINTLNPSKYHPEMKVGLTGKYKRSLFEYQSLLDDIISTAGLCVFLVGLAVFIYYRRFRMVLLMAWTTFNGTFWAFAITAIHIGYLTTQTAFLGSIIVGNGINASLILMARYLEERKKGLSPLECLHIALPATFDGTLASALTTSLAFATLMLTHMKGFSHFGFIGGIGIFFCWLATYTLLPPFIFVSEQFWPLLKKDTQYKKHRFDFSIITPISNFIEPNAKKIVKTAIILGIMSLPIIAHFIPNSLEYNFTKLKTKPRGAAISEESALNDRVKKIFGGSLSPSVLVVDDVKDVPLLCQEIMRKNNLDEPKKRVVDSCKSLYSYVPEDQDEKIAELNKIQDLLKDKTMKFLNNDQKERLEQFKKEFNGEKIRLEDLPESIVNQFKEKNGDVGKIVLIYASDKAPLWNGKNLIHFADLIRENHLPNGKVVTASGDSVIFADLLSAVINDGPKAVILAFIVVCLVVIFIFRDKQAIYYVLGTLSFGVLLMAGFEALFDIKINFFNFIAIPTTFGIGVDYGCNIYQRYKLEGRGSLPHVLKTTGGAVILCSITTIIGYFTLVIAQNQALVSFGWIGLIGEITCLLTAIVFSPALMILIEKKFKK